MAHRARHGQALKQFLPYPATAGAAEMCTPTSDDEKLYVSQYL